MDEAGAAIRSASGHDVFRGAEYAAALPLADGTRDATALASSLVEGGSSVEDAERAVADLMAAGVLVERDDAVDDATAALWRASGVAPDVAAERLARTPVAIASLGVGPGDLPRALTDFGVRIEDSADLVVALVDDYLHDGLAERNEEALETGHPWMLAAPGAWTWIGPVVVPDRGPCWECLAHRLRRHRASGGIADGRARPLTHATAVSASGLRVAEALIATEVGRWIVLGAASGAHERVRSVDPPRWMSVDHAVVRRPQCPACGLGGEAPEARARPVALSERVPAAGGLRAVSADATFERFRHHVSPVSGLVAALAPSGGVRAPRHAYAAGALTVRFHGPASEKGHPNLAGGKGTDDLSARTGALCEALERHSGEFSGDEPRRRAALSEVGDAAIHPNSCMLFSAEQYRRRDELNARGGSGRTYVPEAFDEHAPVDWTPLWSLTGARERLLPTAYCFYHAHVPGHGACPPDSNGNAAGTTVEEAILHGMLELVERDQVAIWWYNRALRPGLDLESFVTPWLASLRATLEGEGRELWALDLTADLGIPVVAALATRADGDGVVMGLGAHTEMRGALTRAVSELVQLDLGAPAAGLGTGPTEAVDDAAGAYLHPDPDAPPTTADAYGPRTEVDIRHELDRCVTAVESLGLEVLVLDQTRPDVGLPVVKVVVPGLRHFWPRFAPGRLYSVPVELGWRDAPLTEDELNPQPPVA